MSRLFFGNASVKIMANDTDDPRTTPNTDWWKFRFNSDVEMAYIREAHRIVYDPTDLTMPTTGSDVDYFYPAGSNINTCHYRVNVFRLSANATTIRIQLTVYPNRFIQRKDRIWFFGALRPTPMASTSQEPKRLYEGLRRPYRAGGDTGYETMRVPKGTDEFGGGNGTWKEGSQWGAGFYAFSRIVSGGNITGAEYVFTEEYYMRNLGRPIAQGFPPAFVLPLFVTDFPVDDQPYPAVAATGTPGVKYLSIGAGNAKVAKPGFPVDTATDEQLIVGHDKPPMKVARSGFFTLAPSATQAVTSPLPLSDTTHVDYQVNKQGQNLWLPPHPSNNDVDSLLVDYSIAGNTVTFVNNSDVTVEVRYFITLDDAEGHSSGSAEILSNKDGVIKLLRPASSGSPRARDILLDSRATFLPVAAQGWVPAASFTSGSWHGGNRLFTASWANSGNWKPYLMARAAHTDVNVPGRTIYTDFYGKRPQIYDFMSASTFMAMVTDTSATFYASTTARTEDAWREPWTSAPRIVPAYKSFVGVRYYVLAVPNSV